MKREGRERRLKDMRPLPFFLAALLAGGCALITTTKAPVIPARDLPRLAVVAEALLRDDGFKTVDKHEANDLFGEDTTRGLRLSARKDDADVFKAAKRDGWAGALTQIFLNDKSSAETETTVDVELYPRPGGHEVRVWATLRRRKADGTWAIEQPPYGNEQTPYGYEPRAFADRLMKAYGDADNAAPLAYPAARPLPLKTPPAPQGVPAGLKSALQPAPAKRQTKSSMLFGPQPTEEP
jgi:hypothetical protein